MKYVKIIVSMVAFSNAGVSMEVVGDENRPPFAFSNAPFSMGSNGVECVKSVVHRKPQKQKVITHYYSKVAKGHALEEGSVVVRVKKRFRMAGEPLSEIDTNAVAGDADSEKALTVSSSASGRARSEALSEDDLDLIAKLSVFGID